MGSDCWKSIGVALGHDSWGKVGLGHLPAFVGHLDGLPGHLEFAPQPDGCLQALGEGLREGRNVRAFLTTPVGALTFNPMARLSAATATASAPSVGIEQPLAFGQLDFDTQHLLLLQRPALGQLLGHLQIVFRPADGVAGRLPQGPRTENLVVRHRDLVGDCLVGPVALQLGDFGSEASLTITTQPTAEVTDKPLQLDLGQLVSGVDVEPNRYRSQGRNKREGGRLPHQHAEAAGVHVEAADRISRRRQWQERGERDVLSAPGLLDALHVDSQPRLLPKSRIDGLGKRERLGRCTGDTTRLSRRRQLDLFGARIVCCFGSPEAGWASAGGLLCCLLWRGGFLVNFEVHRRQDSLGQAFLVAVALVAATQWGGEQEESEKVEPDSNSPGCDRLGRHGQILVDSEGI